MELTPVVCGSALKHKGVRFMLDAVVDFLPSPIDIPTVEGMHPRTDEELTRASATRPSRLPAWPSRPSPSRPAT